MKIEKVEDTVECARKWNRTSKQKWQHINYIYFTSNYVVFVVNDYKTRDVYGVKKFTIKSRPFINACKILLDDKDEYKLIDANN